MGNRTLCVQHGAPCAQPVATSRQVCAATGALSSQEEQVLKLSSWPQLFPPNCRTHISGPPPMWKVGGRDPTQADIYFCVLQTSSTDSKVKSQCPQGPGRLLTRCSLELGDSGGSSQVNTRKTAVTSPHPKTHTLPGQQVSPSLLPC